MARKNAGYQTLPETTGPSLASPTEALPPQSPLPKSASQTSITNNSSNNSNNSSKNNSSNAIGGSAGVPPKIINPTKQAFTQQTNQLQSPIHSQIPGANKVNAATGSGSNSSVNAGSGGALSGRPAALSAAHNLPVGSSTATAASSNAAINRGKVKQPMRTTKTSQKLTLFPEEKDVPVLEDEYVFDDTTYNQIGQLSSSMARNDAHRMSKLDRQKLPRVIAYCTASSYRMDDLFNYLQSRKTTNGAAPKRFDECIYTPFSYTLSSKPPSTADLLGLDEAATNGSRLLHQQQQQSKESIPEVLYFDYGVVVIWGMSEQEEARLLQELSRFEEEKLDDEDVETEEFSYHYNSQYQPRIYNDVITLKSAGNYMVKLTISHAIAQSVKMTLFEGLIENTINATKNIPQTMAETGKVPMSRTAITKKIGQLFIMRINVNLVSNILDTPEIFWSEPSFQPLYSAIRGYLEIGQRVELLNQRTSVISDLLDMLKEHLTSSHGEQLEWIVIILIFFEIVIGVITICLDAVSYTRGGGGH
ncbi:required for meiotic nuclear division protein 1 [Entomortierella parvispora]|uniref:Required for meiotic nuclear division protein 1 n=1 Tax=Entomortierella parvispora TaxID=205924 RepID=A0A9P3HM33_9FUNG|nr:required for meiotic nuclear division protein 1 [Entomortierella parvispora]